MLTTQIINRKLQPDSHSSPKVTDLSLKLWASRDEGTRFLHLKTSSPKINLPKLTTYITTQNMLSKRRGRFLEELMRQQVKSIQHSVNVEGLQVQIQSHQLMWDHLLHREQPE